MSTSVKKLTNPRKVIITGGSGFIGTNLVIHLFNHGFEVLNLDLKPPQDHDKLQCFQFVDILNEIELKNIIHSFRPQFVIHLAARTDLNGRTLSDYSVNTLGTEALIKAIQHCASVKKTIFVSSMLVCKLGYLPASEIDYMADTVYGKSKVIMEKLIRQMQHNYDWSIVRPTSIWGPWFGRPYNLYFNRILNNKMVNFPTESHRTFGFVLNTVHQIESLLLSSAGHERVFYLGDYPPLNINQWTKLIAKEAICKIPITAPMILIKMAALFGDFLNKFGTTFPINTFRLNNMLTDYVLPLEEIQHIAGKQAYSLEDGIKITLDWIKNKNP